MKLWDSQDWAYVAQEVAARSHYFKLTGCCDLCSSCARGRGVFTLSKHGRPLDWAVVAQEVWRWPDSQVNVDADVWQACLHSLGLGFAKGTAAAYTVACVGSQTMNFSKG